MRTYQQKTAETRHDWYIVDAAGQRLGTLAVRIAPRKWTQKVYRRHSGYPGGLRTETAAQVLDKYPERLIERAVRGMLATNRMRDVQLGRLNVYAGDAHPHAAQKPEPLA